MEDREIEIVQRKASPPGAFRVGAVGSTVGEWTLGLVHSTLGRILDPDVAIEALARVRLQCEAITARFEAQPLVIQVEKLWYVDETHHFSAQGPKTTFALQ
ncbi:hypothetical protein PybrP1_007833 [[Pythium] brassicae (nom. inval.)]|nr:hypothetical protein PybrP1_007833 [[Pythium] brassicae (nom. inval.)]